jgi:hypothetical protein
MEEKMARFLRRTFNRIRNFHLRHLQGIQGRIIMLAGTPALLLILSLIGASLNDPNSDTTRQTLVGIGLVLIVPMWLIFGVLSLVIGFEASWILAGLPLSRNGIALVGRGYARIVSAILVVEVAIGDIIFYTPISAITAQKLPLVLLITAGVLTFLVYEATRGSWTLLWLMHALVFTATLVAVLQLYGYSSVTNILPASWINPSTKATTRELYWFVITAIALLMVGSIIIRTPVGYISPATKYGVNALISLAVFFCIARLFYAFIFQGGWEYAKQNLPNPPKASANAIYSPTPQASVPMTTGRKSSQTALECQAISWAGKTWSGSLECEANYPDTYNVVWLEKNCQADGTADFHVDASSNYWHPNSATPNDATRNGWLKSFDRSTACQKIVITMDNRMFSGNLNSVWMNLDQIRFYKLEFPEGLKGEVQKADGAVQPVGRDFIVGEDDSRLRIIAFPGVHTKFVIDRLT